MMASAGASGRVAADLTVAAADETVIGVSGTAEIAPLLPAEIAVLAGDRVAISARAVLSDRMILDPLSVDIAAGRLTGGAAYGGPEKSVAAELHANVSDLSAFSGLLGQPLGGSAVLSATLTGSESQPSIELSLSSGGTRLASVGAEHFDAALWATPRGALDNPDTRIDLAGAGRIIGLAAPEGIALPPEIGRDLDWSFAAAAARDGNVIDLTRLSAAGMGAVVDASGRMTEVGAIEGNAALKVADLRPFSGVAGHRLAGSVEIEAKAERKGPAGFTATLSGAAQGLSTGVAAADALLGGAAAI